MTDLSLMDAVAARNGLTQVNQKRIASLYEKWADQMHMQAVKMDFKGGSAAFAQYDVRYLEEQMKAYSQKVASEIGTVAKDSVFTVSEAVVDAGKQWLEKYGFTDAMLTQAFGSIPHQTVQNLISGSIYEGGWNLSKAIWSDSQKAMQDVYQIVAQGRAMNKPVYDIAKELEAYVSPSKRLSWSTATYKGKRIRIYKKAVDYNAQRLVRTLTQHGYMQAFTSFAKRNPFVKGVRWHANGSRACGICEDRDNKVFDVAKVPLDHPNGMCDLEILYDDDEMQSKLADWVLDDWGGKYPEIDKFAEAMGFVPAKGYSQIVGAENKANWIVSNKLGGKTSFVPESGTKWANKLPKDVQMELKQIKTQLGMSWDEMYVKFAYTGTAEEYMAINPKAAGNVFQKMKKAAAKAEAKSVTHEQFIKELAEKMGGKEYIINYMDVTFTVGWDWGSAYEKELYELIKSVAKDKGMTSFDFWEKYVQGKAKSDKIDDAIAKFFKLQKPTAQAPTPTPTKSGYRYAMDHLGKTSYSTTNGLYADFEKTFGKNALNEFKAVVHEIKQSTGKSYHIDVWESYKKMTLPKAERAKIDAVFEKYGAKAEKKLAEEQAAKDKALAEAKKKAEELKKQLKAKGVQAEATEHTGWQKMLENNTIGWMQENETANAALWTSEERSGINRYTGYHYSRMNAQLNAIEKEKFINTQDLASYLKGKIDDDALDCYKGLEKSVVTEPVVIRRGTGVGEIGELFGDYSSYSQASTACKSMTVEEMQRKFVGQVGVNRQFESCTPITHGGFSGSCELVFYLNPGCEGTSAIAVSQHPNELEFLLNSGHKMICRAIESGGGKGATVRAYIEVLPKV